MDTNDVSRRGFVTAAGATAAAAAVSAPAAAAEEENSSDGGDGGDGGGGGETVPAFGAFLGDANGYEEGAVEDARGQDAVTVEVGAGGGFAFGPATVWVSPGTTVTWEWTGEGGAHNVVANDGPAGLDSGDPVESGSYEYDFTDDDAGITTYYCSPHQSQGMKGGIAVGDDVETTTIEAGGPSVTIPDQALALTVATFFAMTSTLGLGYFFMKYGGDYEQP
ncbi:halocyanin [Halobacteriales archaeon QS_4_69_225]|nr:MAG: halocyanin [Halobacteriales archaeon QS_4_69_225]